MHDLDQMETSEWSDSTQTFNDCKTMAQATLVAFASGNYAPLVDCKGRHGI